MNADPTARALDYLIDALNEAEPAVPLMSDLADSLAVEEGISDTTARKRLRAAIEQSDGQIHELRLTPESFHQWRVVLPDVAPGVGLGQTWIAHYPGTGRVAYQITFDQMRGNHTYGAGRISWVITSDHVKKLHEDHQAELDQADAARRALNEAYDRAASAEVDRRDPDLIPTLDRLTALFDGTGKFGAHTTFRLRNTDEETPMEDRRLTVGVEAWSPEDIAVLKEVINLGIAGYQQRHGN